MSGFDAQTLIKRAFVRLRQKNFVLGVGEYLAALQACEGGFGDDADQLKETLRLLWCTSVAEQSQLDSGWQSLVVSAKPADSRSEREDSPQQDQTIQPRSKPEPVQQDTKSVRQEIVPDQPREAELSELSSVPVQAPNAVSSEANTMLQAYYPISRRSMVYGLRYLRRPVADGPADQLDVEATIAQVTELGVYLSPVYARRERNDAQLLLLIDQNGSMMPFHRFTRDLVETALQESPLLPTNVNVFYFQNVTTASLHKNPFLTDPIPLQEVLSACDVDTSVLVVSDAGAARGYRQRERIRSTTRFLRQIKRHTSLLAWLNPMPSSRWLGSSAEIIANLVPMFQMDNDGLSNAVDVLRGQPRVQGDS